MKSQVITVNRKKYAVGLFWQPTGAGMTPRNFARGLVRSVNKKLSLYTEYRAMTGVGARRYGQRVGMPAAAAEVMNSLTEYSSFLAVFAVGNVFYLVAARNGIILEDKIFDNAAAARAAYSKLFEIPEWSVLIAPNAWGMPRAIERNVSDVVTGDAHATLKPISMLRSRFLSLILIAAFGVLLVGFFREPIQQMLMVRPQISQIDPELAAEYKKRIEENRKELDEQFDIQKVDNTTPQVPELVLPYNNLPDVAARAAVCYQAIGFLMQPISGWVQLSAQCDENNASVQLRRSFGTLGDLYSVATKLMPHSFVQEKSESAVQISAVLPDVKTVASIDERDAETVQREITTIFQGINTPVDINIVVDTVTNGVDVESLNVVEIAASSKLVPMQFMEIFNDFGGVYMTRCGWDASQRIWNYEVIIYAK